MLIHGNVIIRKAPKSHTWRRLPPTAEVFIKVSPDQGFPCPLLPGSLSSRGSLVFRTEDVWLRCNQFIETAEFLIRAK